MKTSLSQLPQEKAEELQRIVGVLEEIPEVEMVILFGSYATGKYVERDRYEENGITYVYQSDFDLLILVTKNRTADNANFIDKISRILKAERSQTPISSIIEGVAFVNEQLEKGNYFFNEIKDEGILLYNSERKELAEKGELNAAETKQQAQENFNEWFDSANEFLISFQSNFERGSFKIAAFELHQATERFYHTISLVFTNYKHKLHDLEDLGKIADSLDFEFKKIFPRQTTDEKHHFHLLLRAYIDSRYKKGYSINKEELEFMAARVAKLRDLTEQICKEKIESFK